MKNKRWFWLAVVLQLLVFAGMIAVHQYTLATGQTVLLRARTAGTWDSPRGQYIYLPYEISQLEADKVSMIGLPYRHGQTLWVTLEPEGEFWQAAAVSDVRPQPGPNQVVLRGKMEWMVEPTEPGEKPPMDFDGPDKPITATQVHIRYGFENIYVPEGQVLNLPSSGDQELAVEMKVDSFGRSAVSRIFLDGQEVQWR